MAARRPHVVQRMLRRRTPHVDDTGREDERKRNERKGNERTQEQPSSDERASSSPPATVLTFDTDTAARFLEHTGGADIKSEDKTFHVLSGDSRVWAVASGGTISKEYATLRAIADAGGNTVLAGPLDKVKAYNKDTMAYPMHWIPKGISSKSNWNGFQSALRQHAKNSSTLTCIATFRNVARQMDAQDFQAIIDPATGIIYANDPRGSGPGGADNTISTRLNRWEEAMQVPSPTETSHPGPTLEFLETDWNAEFEQRANTGKVVRHNLAQLESLFDRGEYVKLMRIGDEGATDLRGTSWKLQHIDHTAGLAYLILC